jgi:hypothetical protein
MLTKLTIAGMISVAVLAAASRAGSVSAQYPPPTGNCVITTSATTSAPGSTVTITVTVRDENGNPVANVPVPLSITKQPGNDASVTAGSTTTDAQGKVTGTLNLGSTGGIVEVTATASGVACSASVTAGTAAVAPAVALPSTGAGAIAGGDAMPRGIVAMLLAGIGAVVAGAAVRRPKSN